MIKSIDYVPPESKLSPSIFRYFTNILNVSKPLPTLIFVAAMVTSSYQKCKNAYAGSMIFLINSGAKTFYKKPYAQ